MPNDLLFALDLTYPRDWGRPENLYPTMNLQVECQPEYETTDECILAAKGYMLYALHEYRDHTEDNPKKVEHPPV